MFGAFSWELRSCGLHGHATYAPDESDLADRLRLATPWGEAWRCLRCGDYVLGTPHGTGPADRAPVLLRGAALRDAFIVRLLALDKTLRGLLIGLVAFGIFRFNGQQGTVQHSIDTLLPLLAPLAAQLGIRVQDLPALHLIEQALALSPHTVNLVAAGIGAYALLNLVEATGLWLMRRWGEYVAVIATSAFLPLEIHELIVRVTPLRIGALVLNLFLVAYLVVSKRLFGVRGGTRAHEAERSSTSLLEVELAATGQRLRPGAGPRPGTVRAPSSGASASGTPGEGLPGAPGASGVE